MFEMKQLATLLIVLAAATCLAGPLAEAKIAWNADNVARLLLQGVSLLLGQKYEPENLTPPHFKQLALTDTSNDDIIQATRQHIIERSGYKTEIHHVVAPDGYITQLIRIINPLVERHHLKGPPVMLLQGGISDPTIWIWGSAIQHHPEKYPRSHEDGPITSYNRSLAFTLANNGFDVWLIGTRGSNPENRGHLKYKHTKGPLGSTSTQSKFSPPFPAPSASFGKILSLLPGAGKPRGNSSGDPVINSDHGHRDLLDRLRYWDYSMDEIATLELPLQIDRVLELTGARNVTLVPISFSGTYTPMTFAEKPQYLKKLHNLVAVAPIVNSRGTNNFWNIFQRAACKFLPSELGNIIMNEILFSEAARHALGRIFRSHQLRYSLLKAMTITLQGSSSMYQTFFEPAVYANINLQTSFKEIKHFCQVVTAGRIQKYDYGPLKNQKLYGSFWPRKYDMSVIDFGNWIILSAENDALAPAKSISDFISLSRTKPVRHISVKHYNHLDMIAGFDLDLKVNLPILEFLEESHLSPAAKLHDEHHSHRQKGDDWTAESIEEKVIGKLADV